MALDFQTPSIAFGQGLDNKTDPKQVIQGKLLALRNGIFTNAKKLSKRNGYDSMTMTAVGGSSITSPYMTRSYQNQKRLLMADGSSLYEYSTTLARWRNTGKYDSIKTENQIISGDTYNKSNTTSLISGNYCYVTAENWTSFTDSANAITSTVTVIDLTNNTTIGTTSIGTSDTGFCKLIAFSDGTIGVFYVVNPGTSGQLFFSTITVSTSGIAVSIGVNLSSSLKQYGADPHYWYSYDICVNSTSVTVAWSDSGAGTPIEFRTINTAGTVGTSGTLASAGNALPLTLSVSGTGNVFVYWANAATASAMPSTSTDIYYCVRLLSTLGAVTAKTSLTTGYGYVRQIVASAGTSQTIYFDNMTSVSGSATINMIVPVINKWTGITTAGSGSGGGSKINVLLFGKLITFGSKTFLPVVFPSNTQFTGFMLDTSDLHVAAKFLYDTAEAAYSSEINSGLSAGGFWWRYPGFTATPYTYGSTQIIMGSGKVVQALLGATATAPSFVTASCLVTFTFNDSDAFQGFESNGSMILNGSVVSLYDGNQTTEMGFNYFPEINGTAGTSGGSMADGVYTIQAVYEFIDNNGNIITSSSSDPVTVTVSGGSGSGKITVTLKYQTITAKSGTIVIKYYRSLDGGSIPYLVAQIANSTTGTTASYVDTGSSQNQSEPIYTQGGAILDNSAPPCSMLMWLNNNRLFAVDSENPSTDVWYTKTFSRLGSVNFSQSLLNVTDPRLGNIKAGIAMDEKTILLKDSGVQYFIGDGANDSGQGASFSPPQIVPSDVGCSYSKGVISYPDGVIFRASNNKGIYRLSRGMQVEYFGAAVEGFNSQDIQDAQMIANRSQIRFLTSSGYSIVYDYIFQQWSTFSNHTGYSSCIWNGTYVYARTDGLIYSENSSSFLDNATAFSLYAQTAWFKGASIQNFQRIKGVEFLGDFTGSSSHGLQCSVAYDFSSTTIDLDPIYFTGSDGPYQWMGFLPQQKCDAFQLTFNELTSGASGEFVDLSDLAIEIGLKKGFNKVPASNSIG